MYQVARWRIVSLKDAGGRPRVEPAGSDEKGWSAMDAKGKIAVLVEAHFDEHEYRLFNQFFPQHGYSVDYVSDLWGQPELTFKGNDFTEEVTVRHDVRDVVLADYQGLILIGGYAMDRLRYEEHPHEGRPNQAPAVALLRRAVEAMDEGRLKIGTICHSLWLFCAAPELLAGRAVTCAHNIISDVAHAGGAIVFDGDQTADVHVDGGLISGRHPGVADKFIEVFTDELEKSQPVSAAGSPRT